MTPYQETEKFLYERLPMFQRIGPAAYKKDLKNTIALCELLGHPEKKFKSIHIAGTNGKGSSSHMLASIFQSAGYKTGLYTSPHLKSFTERIKINGKNCDESFVVKFVERLRPSIDVIEPSFFELTTAMAFEYFAMDKVDIAIIEVGLGGRLDCTNVIQPEVSLITNIGFDHQQFLGDTLPRIAAEKAGIIKKGTPVVVSQTQAEVLAVFQNKAREMNSPISFADQNWSANLSASSMNIIHIGGAAIEIPAFPLGGAYQEKNLPGVMETVEIARTLGWRVDEQAVVNGLSNVVTYTGLKGRWQKIGESPLVICDTGHNIDGIKQVMRQILQMKFHDLRIVFGMVNDKEPLPVLQLLPTSARYYFCEAPIPRAMKADELVALGESIGLKGRALADVNAAITAARQESDPDDLIFVGGSTFVVAAIDSL
jgi:dihydrofolate synthase / folylpolyglutamate synthase